MPMSPAVEELTVHVVDVVVDVTSLVDTDTASGAMSAFILAIEEVGSKGEILVGSGPTTLEALVADTCTLTMLMSSIFLGNVVRYFEESRGIFMILFSREEWE